MKNKKYSKNIIVASILSLVFIFFTLLIGFSSLPSKEFKLDKFCYDLDSYNHPYNSTTSAYINVSSTDKNSLYNDLYTTFYYGLESGSIRQYLEGNQQCIINDDFSYTLNCFVQQTMSISTTPYSDGGYRVDYGLFDAYFSDTELGQREYLGPKYGAQTFIYLSDLSANKILNYYNLPQTKDSYLKLIKNEKYSKLKIKLSENKIITTSINNILYSNRRSASRCNQFFSDYGLICFNYIKNDAHPVIDIDLKNYPFYTKRVFNGIESLGYNYDNSKFSFYSYDSSTNSYVLRPELEAQYAEAFKSNSMIIIVSTEVLVAAIVFLALLILLIKKLNSNLLWALLFESILFILFSIFAIFSYVSLFFTITPTVLFIVTLIMCRGRVNEIFRKFIPKKRLQIVNI